MAAVPDTADGTGASPAAKGDAKVFGRNHRLRTKAHMDAVRRHGRSRAGRQVVVVGAPSQDGLRRVAFVISRRFSLRAVDRNRARRLLREAYRLLLPRLQSAWILFIPRRGCKGASLGDMMPEIETHLRALGLLDAPAEPRAGPEPEKGDAPRRDDR